MQPLYGYGEADYLANVSRGTARRWLAGYAYQDAGGRPVRRPPMTAPSEEPEGVSFLDLVEVVAIGRLKEMGLSLTRIRQVVANCQEILGVSRPLVTLRFKSDGREIFVDRGDVLIEVGLRKRMQAWNELLHPFLEELDYGAHELARRWWPLGRKVPVVIDPEYGFGYPVVANSGVRTEIILERFKAGDLEEQIVRDFNVKPIEVERALQFELNRAA
jgi:uncharacterized protein (DUF433 family)